MAIPDYQTLMLPLLKKLADGGESTTPIMSGLLADEFGLDEEERDSRLKNGQKRLNNKVAWAKTYLIKAGLVSMVRRGVYAITPRGLEVVNKPPDKITNQFLSRYPEFNDFITKRSSEADTGTETPSSVIAETQDVPEEQIETAFTVMRERLAEELLGMILQSHPKFFEDVVVDLMLKMGYGGPGEDAGMVTSYGSDEGIDGVINEDKLGLDVIYLQAKRWGNTVGRPEIQKFVGALHGKRARKGVFLTTSNFSKEAVEYVKTIEPRVILIDGNRLASLMIDYGVGVYVSETFEVKKVDSDYFDYE